MENKEHTKLREAAKHDMTKPFEQALGDIYVELEQTGPGRSAEENKYHAERRFYALQVRAMNETHEMSKATYTLSIVSAVIALIGLAVAVLTYFFKAS